MVEISMNVAISEPSVARTMSTITAVSTNVTAGNAIAVLWRFVPPGVHVVLALIDTPIRLAAAVAGGLWLFRTLASRELRDPRYFARKEAARRRAERDAAKRRRAIEDVQKRTDELRRREEERRRAEEELREKAVMVCCGMDDKRLEAETEAAEQQEEGEANEAISFSAADDFMGVRAGFVFKMGEKGLGYYKDVVVGGEEQSRTVGATCHLRLLNDDIARKIYAMMKEDHARKKP
mmetsp:Transcript_55583/g.130197  ORF Transcript_55583/g.130197 Transcript_55583/m.130197 type:complete len:236 (+) Transcript_55583:267-974(+)